MTATISGRRRRIEADVEDSQASFTSITPVSGESLQSVSKVDFTHAVDAMKIREADEALCLGFDDTPVAEAVALPVGVHVGEPTEVEPGGPQIVRSPGIHVGRLR